MPCPRSSPLPFQQTAKRLRLAGALVEFAPRVLDDVGAGALDELTIVELRLETSDLRVKLVELALRVPIALAGRGQAHLSMKGTGDERHRAVGIAAHGG